MNTATTAAVAAVDAPKISRNSRCHAVWYTSAQNPDPKTRTATLHTARGSGWGAGRGCAGARLARLESALLASLETAATAHLVQALTSSGTVPAYGVRTRGARGVE